MIELAVIAASFAATVISSLSFTRFVLTRQERMEPPPPPAPPTPKERKREILERRRTEVFTWDRSTPEAVLAARTRIEEIDRQLLALEDEVDTDAAPAASWSPFEPFKSGQR